MMNTYALIAGGLVENVLLWDGIDSRFPEGFPGKELVQIDPEAGVAPGWTYIGGEFVAPPTPEPPAPKAPRAVTMRQARLALFAAGKLADVNAAIDSLPSPQKESAQIEWEYAATVERESALIGLAGAALGLTEADLDDLFTAAAAL